MNGLDLFSTGQTKQHASKNKTKNTDRRIYDECINNAPYFAYQIEAKKWGVVQGCCNDWNCPRCGQQRAREEYGRIVVGAREIAKAHSLYFLTITCRGKEMSLQDAEQNYLLWTNRLLTSLRIESKRAGGAWYYASVTERQKRLHPHSHYITTYCPDDTVFIKKGEGKTFVTTGDIFPAKHDTLQSYHLERACVRCGLGNQYDLSGVRSVEAGSRYVSKYLFKETIFSEIWPKGWRRVRYSNNWPKLPEVKGDAFILMKFVDWLRLGREALIIKTPNDGVAAVVRHNLIGSDTIIQ